MMRRARPEQAIADAAWRRALAGLKETGLSPAARTRIDVEPPMPSASRESACSDQSVARFFHDVDTLKTFEAYGAAPKGTS
jgi:hypothetical protein